MEWESWYSCFLQWYWGSFYCYYWCSILTYGDHATSQISCKKTSSCCLKHSHSPKIKIIPKCEHINILHQFFDNYGKLILSICDGIVNKLHVFPDTKFYWLQSYVCWPCQFLLHTKLAAKWAIPVYKILKYMFCCELHNSWLIFKICIGFVEQIIRYICTIFLSDLMISKFWHKLTYIYK